MELHYGGGSTSPGGVKSADDPAFEIEYAPYGVQSGLCVGVAATAAQGGKVSLQPCGVTSKTVWIADVGLVPGTPGSSVSYTTVTTTTYDGQPDSDPHSNSDHDHDHDPYNDHHPADAGEDQGVPVR